MKMVHYGLFSILVLGVIFIWRAVPVPCEQPLEYALGMFDSRFGLSEAEFLQETVSAERLWEDALGQELFRFAPEAPFKVNLIFDERQERTLEAEKLESSLEKTKDTKEKLEQKQKTVLERYEQARKVYESALATFENRLAVYNADVAKWNKRGGAPPDEYTELSRVAQALEQEGQVLESKRLALNQLVKELNTFSTKSVALVEAYNEEVDQYVHRYGEPQQFDQGEYVGEEINIYQYDDLPHLRLVLVHEFGHALGLTHGNDPRSIMFHLMRDQDLDPLVLSNEDTVMLNGECSQTVWDIVLKRIDTLQEQVAVK
jgi:hypothetical protein